MHEFYHVTDMIKDEKEPFIKLVYEMLEKRLEFLKFVDLFDSYKGVEIVFYQLDSDDYGYSVSRWKITFKPSNKDKVIFKGYYEETLYRLLEISSNEVRFDGEYSAILDYINSEKFSHLSQQEFDKIYKFECYKFDKFKEWSKEICSVPIEHIPDIDEFER